MKRISLLASVLFLLLSSPICGQVKKLSREAIDSVRNRTLLDGRSEILAFGIDAFDFGTMYESDTARIFSFPFTNISNAKVVIKNISANCGCIDSYCDKYEFAPGEKGCLFVKFNPNGRSGTVDKNIFVYTQLSDMMPVAKLTLLGNVVDLNEWWYLPVSMGGALRLKRKEIVLEPVRPGTKPQIRIACANVGMSPLRLFSRLLPDFVTFATEPTELESGEEGDIVITIDGDKLPERSNSRYSILVEGVEGRISDRMIELKFENIKE